MAIDRIIPFFSLPCELLSRNGHTNATEPVMRLLGCLFAAFSMIGVCPVVSAFTDPVPVTNEPVPEITAVAPVEIVVEAAPRAPVTNWQRLQWFDVKTFGVSNLLGSIPGAGLQTFLDRPREAGPHWEGFGERYGVALSTNGVSNAMEASLGIIWGEDPRYLRDGPSDSFKRRLGHIVKWTVVAPNRDGELRPAYARFIAYSSSSFISNAWREPSDTDAKQSLGRIGFDLLGRAAGNAFDEFWPDVKRKFFHGGSD
jgi:hypothetical protein